MKLRILMCILSFAVITEANEFRTFTNLEGETIEACILQYDSEGSRVFLMLQNKKKAWIEISSLSQADQVYIKDSSEKSDDTVTARAAEVKETTNLSRKELRDIGKQLVKAVTEKDYETWVSMLSEVHHQDPTKLNKNYFARSYNGADISIAEVDENNLCIKLIIAYKSEEQTQWVFVLPDGKVKYDGIVFQHPLEEAVWRLELSAVHPNKALHTNDFLWLLPDLNIPNHDGHDVNASSQSQDRKKVIEQIAEWIITTRGDWDNCEPKCKYPPDGFKLLVHKLNNL